MDEQIREVGYDADLLGGYQVNHELKLRGLFYWQVGRLGAFENFVYVGKNIAIEYRFAEQKPGR